jgi:hypothetical protein
MSAMLLGHKDRITTPKHAHLCVTCTITLFPVSTSRGQSGKICLAPRASNFLPAWFTHFHPFRSALCFRLPNLPYSKYIFYLSISGPTTAVAVFRNPDTIPFCLTTDLLLNVLFPSLSFKVKVNCRGCFLDWFLFVLFFFALKAYVIFSDAHYVLNI